MINLILMSHNGKHNWWNRKRGIQHMNHELEIAPFVHVTGKPKVKNQTQFTYAPIRVAVIPAMDAWLTRKNML